MIYVITSESWRFIGFEIYTEGCKYVYVRVIGIDAGRMCCVLIDPVSPGILIFAARKFVCAYTGC